MVDDAPIYRGLKLPPGTQMDDIINLTTRMDRRPKDTSILASMIFNYGIQCRFGVSDVRKTSIFAACNFSIANQYARDAGTGVVQLILPANALVIYNRSVGDSMMLLERRDVRDFTLHVGNYIEDPTVEQYLSQNSGQLFHDLVADAVKDVEEFTEIMRMFEDIALDVTNGYVADHVSELSPLRTDGTEYMIQGVSAYQAKVVKVRAPSNFGLPPKPKADDSIPF